MMDESPLYRYSDEVIIAALKSETAGLKKGIAAIDGVATGIGTSPPLNLKPIVLGNSIYFDQTGGRFVVLVTRHKIIKAITRKVEMGSIPGMRLAPGQLQSTFDPSYKRQLEDRTNRAFSSGAKKTSDGWQLVPR